MGGLFFDFEAISDICGHRLDELVLVPDGATASLRPLRRLVQGQGKCGCCSENYHQWDTKKVREESSKKGIPYTASRRPARRPARRRAAGAGEMHLSVQDRVQVEDVPGAAALEAESHASERR